MDYAPGLNPMPKRKELSMSTPHAGYSSNGLPYAHFGSGKHTLVIFSGSELENKPLSGLALKSLQMGFAGLAKNFDMYMISRRPGMPAGYTAQDMSNDFAAMIRTDIGKPVHVMGISSGGSSALHFAVDHHDMVDRFVLAFSAHRMTAHGIAMCRVWRDMALAKNWNGLYKSMGVAIVEGAMPDWVVKPMMSVFGPMLVGKPDDGSDFAILLDADINLNMEHKLSSIAVPTLVIGGNRDPFYSQDLMREAAEYIPNAKLTFLSGGHSAMKSQSKAFEREVLRFLTATMTEATGLHTSTD
jgi:pimeloyl-ACP methyl ester carboxylesterase